MSTIIFNDSTISSNGSAVFNQFYSSQIILLLNITNSPTGTNPSITFMIQEVDPVDQITSLGDSVITSPITSSGVYTITLNNYLSDTILVSWVVSGTNSPTFTGINGTLVQKISGPTVNINPAFNIKSLYDLSNSSVIYIGTAPLGSATSSSVWQIKKVTLDVSGNPTNTLWSSFTAIWDNRTSEIYS